MSGNEILTSIEGITVTNLRKIMRSNPKIYKKKCKILSFCFQDIERKHNSDINQGPQLYYKCAKMTGNNPKLDLVKINA